MRPIILFLGILAVSGCGKAEEPTANDKEIESQTAHLLALEANNPVTWLVFSASGPQKDFIPMRCFLRLTDTFGPTPQTSRMLSWSLQISDSSAKYVFNGYLRRDPKSDPDILKHLGDGSAHLAIAKMAHSYDPGYMDAVAVNDILQWDSWDDTPRSKP